MVITKRVICCLSFCLLLFLGGCYNLSVSSCHDASFDPSRYFFYTWSATPEGSDAVGGNVQNPFFKSWVRRAVDRELAARGYVLKNNGPVDFIVNAHTETFVVGTIVHDPLFYPGGYYRGHNFRGYAWRDPFWPQTWVSYHEDGILVIDITDALLHKPLWRAASRGVVREYGNDNSMRESVDHAVSEMIERFCPLKKQR